MSGHATKGRGRPIECLSQKYNGKLSNPARNICAATSRPLVPPIKASAAINTYQNKSITQLADDDQRFDRRLIARNAMQPLRPVQVTFDPHVAPRVTQGTIQQEVLRLHVLHPIDKIRND